MSTGADDGRGSDAGPTRREPRERSGTAESVRRTLDDLLPAASIDSRWWYWIAAVPVLFGVSLGLGGAAVVLFLFGVALDVAGFAGVASLGGFVLFWLGTLFLGFVGLLVAVLFPIATYVDARAIEEAGLEWRPDPVLYGLAAAAAVLATNFVLSVPLALYYLYRRHGAVGTP
jgi:hypothetical protein